jgi:succinyl-CoA synthetase alpha subunit
MVEIPSGCTRKELFDSNRPPLSFLEPVTNMTAATTPSGCIKTHRPNVTVINNQQYYVPDSVYDAFMEQYVAMITSKDPVEEAKAQTALTVKWAHLVIGPGHPRYFVQG